MRAREIYQGIDENSDPGAPLTFYSAVYDPSCPPPFEDCPFFIAPGYTYSISVEHFPKYAVVVFHHDPNGVEVTKEVLLDIIEPLAYSRKAGALFQIFNMDDDDFCYFLDGLTIWAKMEFPQPNVFYCYGVTYPSGLTTGNNNCAAVSLAY